MTSKHSKHRISKRLWLRSRLSALVLVVGRGGKTLFGEQLFESLVKGRLIALDGHEVISPAFKEDLLRGLLVGVKGVSEDDFVHQVLLVQNQPRGGDLISFGRGHDTAQKPALGVHRVDNLHPGMTHFLTVHNDDLILRGT